MLMSTIFNTNMLSKCSLYFELIFFYLVFSVETRAEAKAAGALVDVTYSKVETPITDIKVAIEKSYMHKDTALINRKMGDIDGKKKMYPIIKL